MLLFSWLSGDQFLVWGWRIPFLLSIVMVGVGLWIRLGILETPVFQQLLAGEADRAGAGLEVIKRQPKEIILCGAGANGRATAPVYIYIAFVFAYAARKCCSSRASFLLTALIAACGLAFVRPSRSRAICPTGSAASACI